MKLEVALTLALAVQSAAVSSEYDYGEGRPLEGLSYFDGLLGFSGRFRGIFDNAEYSYLRVGKPDQRTFFQTDFLLYCDLRPAENLLIQIGPKVVYEFGNEENTGSLDWVRGSGASVHLRLRGIYNRGGHEFTFGHFRETQTPLTLEWEAVDDETAGIRWRWTRGIYSQRFFLSRVSTVGNYQYETFAGAGRVGITPGTVKFWHYALNIAAVHQGGFDTGGIRYVPPVGERKREVIVGSASFDQPVFGGAYAAGEAAYSISKSDVNDTIRDNGFWCEVGFRRSYFSGSARIYRIGKYFETPWGVDFLRNDEGIAYVADFLAFSCKASVEFKLNRFSELYISLEFGRKWHGTNFSSKDYDFSNQIITFQVFL